MKKQVRFILGSVVGAILVLIALVSVSQAAPSRLAGHASAGASYPPRLHSPLRAGGPISYSQSSIGGPRPGLSYGFTFPYPATGLAAPAAVSSSAQSSASRASSTTAPCTNFIMVPGTGMACREASLWRVKTSNGITIFTHGPDPAPGVNGFLDGSPPVSTSNSGSKAPAPAVAAACVDPSTTPHVEIYYTHFSDRPDNYAAYAGDISAQFQYVDGNVLDYDAYQYFGYHAHLAVACNSDGTPFVGDVTLATPFGSSNFGTIVNDVQAAGHTSTLAHYWIWTDGNPTGYGGQSGIFDDDQPGPNNANNTGPQYSVNYGYTGGGGGAIFAHENGHAIGAVQLSAPNSTGAWHCIDGWDIMCYDDQGPRGYLYNSGVCPFAPNGTKVFDCNFNDYFNPNPAPDNYLFSHWDTVYNRFLVVPDSSQFISQSVPSSMFPGQTASVSLTLQNTGSSTWTPDVYRLGSWNPKDNTIWGLGRAYLSNAVPTWGTATFNFTITAPSTAGTYHFDWRMVQDGFLWFGFATPDVAIAVQPCTASFSDVHPSDYFYTPVSYLVCHGIISGYNDGTFRPYNNTTRAQLAKIIVLGEGWAINTGGGPHFYDVSTSNPFYGVIETAYNHGAISGYSDGTFRPYTNVTRGQLSKIIVSAQGWAINTSGGPHFTDVSPSNPFYGVIETAYNHGIISGYSDGTFRWGNNAIRGQIAKIVYLALTGPAR